MPPGGSNAHDTNQITPRTNTDRLHDRARGGLGRDPMGSGDARLSARARCSLAPHWRHSILPSLVAVRLVLSLLCLRPPNLRPARHFRDLGRSSFMHIVFLYFSFSVFFFSFINLFFFFS